MRNRLAVLIAAVLPPFVFGCTDVNVIPTQTSTQTMPGSSPGVVVGTPTPIGSGGPVATVGVGFFGGSCPSGAGTVANNQPIRVGCRGDITATPKDAAGQKLEPVVHGTDCQWTNDNPGAVTVFVDGNNVFNAVIEAKGSGAAKVCATVKGVTGCMTVVVL